MFEEVVWKLKKKDTRTWKNLYYSDYNRLDTKIPPI